ncbi:short chain dehydrogenase [Thraustotheca clavata]|uniref:Short chain dehydrogenase n=1 Tax=Thraustotheca clavata TaxID=74557 RepID=A0A1V9Z257_9STRA|nr:short chain dehydrogenase [Thraustotheca clavata]
MHITIISQFASIASWPSTGANRGIGLTYAKHYKAKGWNVTVREAASAVGATTPIDLLINNAGLLIADSLETATKANMNLQFEINVVGPFLVSPAFLPNLPLAHSGEKLAILAYMTSRMGSIDDNSSSGYYGYRASKNALHAVGKYVITGMTGMRGEITPEQSVAGLTAILEKVKMADNYHSNGSLLPW